MTWKWRKSGPVCAVLNPFPSARGRTDREIKNLLNQMRSIDQIQVWDAKEWHPVGFSWSGTLHEDGAFTRPDRDSGGYGI